MAQQMCKLPGHIRNAGITRRCLSLMVKGFNGKTSSSSKMYDVVTPGVVSGLLAVPLHIEAPNYDAKGFNLFGKKKIDIKTGIELEKMKRSCKLARKIMNIAIETVQVGIATDEIDHIVHGAIIDHGAYPSPLRYRGYPKSICTSVNNVVCHGIPDNRPLQNGDVLSIDVTVYQNGYHGDCAETVAVGEADESAAKLIEAARECRDAAIRICGPDVRFSLIGSTVSSVAKSFGFNVVPVFCGHGIGSYFHGPPDILHFENNYAGKMAKGMTFTIEPVISEGRKEVIVLKDGWTAVTVDHSRAAQFEHTILITDNGSQILTE